MSVEQTMGGTGSGAMDHLVNKLVQEGGGTPDPEPTPDPNPNPDPEPDPNPNPQDPDPSDPQPDPDPDPNDPDPDPDPNDPVELTEEEVKAIRDKSEEERTDEEKEILRQIDEADDDDDSNVVSVVTDVFKTVIPEEMMPEGEYENSVEGLRNMLEDMRTPLAQQYLQEELVRNPELYEFYSHLRNGGTKESFGLMHQVRDYSSFDLKTEDGQIAMVKHNLMETKGLDASQAELLIEGIKSKGELQKAAENAKLQEDQLATQKAQAQYEQEVAIREEQAAQLEKINAEISEIASKGKLGGLNIPKTEMQNLIDYMSSTDENGISQVALDSQALPVELQMLGSYLIMKKFQVPGIQAKVVESKEFKKIQDQNKKRYVVQRTVVKVPKKMLMM